MTLKLANSASALLAGSISGSGTEISLPSGQGSLFPSLAGGEWFPLVLVAADGFEIVRATARSNDVITIARAQEGTSARAFDAGSRVDLRLTAAAIADIIDDLNATITSTVTEAVSEAVTDLEGKLSAETGDSLISAQETAPVGWEQDTDVNDRVLRVVSNSTGGDTGGTWVISGLTVGNTTLTINQTPAHQHGPGTLETATHNHTAGTFQAANHSHHYERASGATSCAGGGISVRNLSEQTTNTSNSGSLNITGNTGTAQRLAVETGQTASAGGGQAHSHPNSHDGNWRPAYLNCIRIVKVAA